LSAADERGAVDGQNFAKVALGNFSGEGERLQQCELRGFQTKWPQSRFVVLVRHPRSPTETGGQAGGFQEILTAKVAKKRPAMTQRPQSTQIRTLQFGAYNADGQKKKDVGGGEKDKGEQP